MAAASRGAAASSRSAFVEKGGLQLLAAEYQRFTQQLAADSGNEPMAQACREKAIWVRAAMEYLSLLLMVRSQRQSRPDVCRSPCLRLRYPLPLLKSSSTASSSTL